MITASFRHIQGLGPLRERQLWAKGVVGWSALPEGEILSPRLDGRLRAGVEQSVERFEAGDFDHFAKLLPETEHWRLLPHLLEGAAFVDVEVGSSRDELAVIGVMDALGVRAFVRGKDLHEFRARSAAWSCLVTFNGLKPLAELAYNRLLERTGLPAQPIEVTERGALLYDVSRAVEAALR